ncbi:VCBS repeat-containing protein [Coraliomargarita sp. SDUM461004]|uniref:VCBS repeat-containing protein n=1 Tax=Thalassobacterium sedimentorum TaxID=3041258 RepID=A0ABU1ADV7_9BACT|nr:VCBS repeat-containing protein [Coraliomargarita sp. SDUM461004]MDQ8192920.1 VCBS repeat-containing protein [Coraliomargarita sp. SDUM461004]
MIRKLRLLVTNSSLFLGSLAISHAQEFRKLPPLTVEPDVTHALSLGFTGRSLIPWFGIDEAPAVLITGHGPYFPQRDQIYRATGYDGTGKAFALPADYALYEPMPFDVEHAGTGAKIGGGYAQAIPRADGLFDLIRFSSTGARYYRNTGNISTPNFAEPYTIEMKQSIKPGNKWVADVNDDGVVDLLIGGMNHDSEKFNQYPDWPKEKGPWSGDKHPNMGILPDTDIQPFRGYDIAGNWMGSPVRKYLWWAKGSLSDTGELQFDVFKNVRYGETDYKVQWHDFGTQLSPIVMSLEGQTYIIVFSGPQEVLALPLRGEDESGELRTGKSVPLLKNGQRTMSSVNLPYVVGLGDMNNDGHDDIVVGSGANGRLTVLSGKRMGEFEEMGNVFSKGGIISGDTLSVPARADWDNDGYPDIVVGDGSGFYSLWRGSEDPLVYQSSDYLRTESGVIRHRPVDGNLQGEVEMAWSYTQPELFDWDGDGYMDLISNDNEAKLFLYRGNGSAITAERERFMLGEKPLPIAWRSRPAVVNGQYKLAGDNRNCLLLMTWDNKLAYAVPDSNGSLNFEKVIDLNYENGAPIILCGPAGLSGRLKFAAVDWDEDGVWDIVTGVQRALQKYFRAPGTESPSSAPYWLRNIGTNDQPIFEPARMITFKDGTPIRVKGHEFSVYPTDLNKDGHLDIIFGEDEGFVFYLMRDQLAWDEDISATKQMMNAEVQAHQNAANLEPGILVAEDWNYPNQISIESNKLNRGQGWSAPWNIHAPTAKITNDYVNTPNVFSTRSSGNFIRMLGDGKQTASIERMLAQPFNLEQEVPTTLIYQIDWQRTDHSDNDGNEGVKLLGLSTLQGKTLIAIEINSAEELEIRIDNSTTKTDGKLSFVGAWTLRAEIDLNSEGKAIEVRAIVAEEVLPKHINDEDWSLKATGKVDGIISALTLSVGKYAGFVDFENLQLSVK